MVLATFHANNLYHGISTYNIFSHTIIGHHKHHKAAEKDRCVNSHFRPAIRRACTVSRLLLLLYVCLWIFMVYARGSRTRHICNHQRRPVAAAATATVEMSTASTASCRDVFGVVSACRVGHGAVSEYSVQGRRVIGGGNHAEDERKDGRALGVRGGFENDVDYIERVVFRDGLEYKGHIYDLIWSTSLFRTVRFRVAP